MFGDFFSRDISKIYDCSSSERSGKKKRINVATTGKTIPIKNHILGFLPIRFASLEVIIGMLSMQIIPRLINNAAPI
jgi:hypothetical protein